MSHSNKLALAVIKAFIQIHVQSKRDQTTLPYLEPPFINAPVVLCVWGLGGKGGAFEPELAVASISFGLQQLRRAFGLGPPAPNGSREGPSNDSELDLAFIPTPSQGFGGADITQTLIPKENVTVARP